MRLLTTSAFLKIANRIHMYEYRLGADSEYGRLLSTRIFTHTIHVSFEATLCENMEIPLLPRPKAHYSA
jgi:hypothetical protein